ncbi:MAG: Fic family protein [Rhizobiales bacterium]|nr:Fic family protein [Hyphomicrobiales bacterium]
MSPSNRRQWRACHTLRARGVSNYGELVIWTPTELAAYGLWRLNWIHPFVEGNGRTARATCYYILCVRSGALLPGRKVLPERIKESRTGYESGLQAADRAWETGHLDFTEMEDYLAGLVQAQLQDDNVPYQGASSV